MCWHALLSSERSEGVKGQKEWKCAKKKLPHWGEEETAGSFCPLICYFLGTARLEPRTRLQCGLWKVAGIQPHHWPYVDWVSKNTLQRSDYIDKQLGLARTKKEVWIRVYNCDGGGCGAKYASQMLYAILVTLGNRTTATILDPFSHTIATGNSQVEYILG